jgi:rhodanese-related sulfurtransferase
MVEEIDVAELAARMTNGLRLYDVREPAEYEAGHVPGAVLIPLGDVAERAEEFRGDGPAYLVCRSGARSMRACTHLAELGIETVNIAGGTLAWADSGRAVEEGHPTA